MNTLSSRGLLAIAAVMDIALNARGQRVSSRALAERHGLSSRHFETLLQDLVRATVLKAYRGPQGGYELARERRRITVGGIVRAVAKEPDADAKPRPLPLIVTDVIGPALAPASEAFLAELDRITIDDLCRRAESRRAEGTSGFDFAI